VFDLLEIELTRVRRMAEQTGDDLLLYLIDLAIIAANAKARSMRTAPEEANRSGALRAKPRIFALGAAQDLELVR